MPLTKRIGVSTHFLPAAHGESLWTALQLVLDSGLRGIELVPADYQGQVGSPHTVRSVGLWPRGFGRADRERLRGTLAQFDSVTIHAPHLGPNISSVNRGIREETARQYIECIQLAVDTGVRTVTFPGGRPVPGFSSDPADIIRPMVRFGKLAGEFATDNDLTFGYEFDDIEQAKRVLDGVNHPRFGVCLDFGLATISGKSPRRWVESFGERVVSVHISGVLQNGMGLADHQPICRNNAIDYLDALTALRAIGYAGPLQCEIQGLDIADTVSHCLFARQRLNAIWEDLQATSASVQQSEALFASPAESPWIASEEARDCQ